MIEKGREEGGEVGSHPRGVAITRIRRKWPAKEKLEKRSSSPLGDASSEISNS